MNQHPITFAAHKQDMSLKQHIRRAFLRNIKLTIEDLDIGSIRLEDGTEWMLVFEDHTLAEKLEDDEEANALISFQVWQDGSLYAVARLFKEGM